MKVQDAKAAVGKEWGKLENLPVRDSTKVKSRSEVVQQTKKNGRLVHVATLMNVRDLKHSELSTHFRKYKRRLVLQRQKTAVDSEQHSRSKEHPLRKWQR